MNNQTIQSPLNLLDEILYLSLEVFAPEVIAPDPQQVPTPPVCFSPPPHTPDADLTLAFHL